ncbi:MAG: hypothetical protein JNM93_00490 [Bacteriovoracaceae bacterium]|nr:hypothetical protein [Bacteriovoracaceae bacterium]
MKTLILSLFVLSACTSLPKGDLQLKKMMLDDQPREPRGGISYVHAGRPLYVESTSYPYLLPDGHISMEGKLLVYVGREELSLNELLPTQKEEETQEKQITPEIKEPSPFIREVGGPRHAQAESIIFPKTPGTETFADFLKLQEASIKEKDKRFVNHFKCARPKITQNGNCDQLQVEFDLTKCFGSPFIKTGHKVSCNQDEALFGVRLNNVRYRVSTIRPPLPVKGQWNLKSQIQVTFYKP